MSPVLLREPRVLIPGQASGAALVLDETLSFWGGFNPQQGRITDVHHPQYQQCVGGRVLCISQSKGSAGTPAGIAETLRNGSGPVAFLLGEADVNISVGVLVANKLYAFDIPVVLIPIREMAQIQSGDRITITTSGDTILNYANA